MNWPYYPKVYAVMDGEERRLPCTWRHALRFYWDWAISRGKRITIRWDIPEWWKPKELHDGSFAYLIRVEDQWCGFNEHIEGMLMDKTKG